MLNENIFIPDLSPHLEKIKQENEGLRIKQELLKIMATAPPFPEKELTEEKKQERLERSAKDFWYWDKTYFTKGYYDDYATPGKFHKELVSITDCRDKKAHIIIGSRSVAKTSMLKKKFIYDFLHGKRRNMAAASETLDAPGNFLIDMIYFLTTNERILFDYNLTWFEKSSEKLYAKSAVNPKGTFVDILSIERSSKGRSRGLFLRYDYIFVTDWENRTSSLTKEAVEKRIDRLNEMRTSLSDDGTMVAEGNNFDPDCAQNQIKKEHDAGILSDNFILHIYPAWDSSRPPKQRSLWYAKYPADSEEELKKLMKPKDDIDWSGDFQQNPQKRSGKIFPDTYYAEWDFIPRDLKSVIYTDPNLSLKQKGDTTASTGLGWSVSTQRFYIFLGRCKSYDSSNDLLFDYLMAMKQWRQLANIIDTAMDGNVAQEAQWTNNINNFARIHGFPFPPIQFKKYKVDDLVSPVETEWKRNMFLFPPGFSKTEEGKAYLKQLFGFRTKKAKKKDDAPDSLISAYTFLVELGIAFTTTGSGFEYKSVTRRNIHKI